MKDKNIKRYLVKLLREISKQNPPNFSGVGFILYSFKNFPLKYCSSLRPSMKCPDSIFLNNPKRAVDFFCRISNNYHKLHDGYHLFDGRGRLTHISQYFWPPIVKGIKPDESYGTRHLSAKYGSRIKGVLAMGIISHDRKASYFVKGKSYKIQ